MSSDRLSRRHRFRRRLSRLHTEVERLAAELPEFPDVQDLHDLAGHGATFEGFGLSETLAPGLPRIRPVLVHLAANAAGAAEHVSTDEVVFAAEFLELAVRLHDAALGRQDGRRRRAARRVFGGAVHWLGGHQCSLRALELARHAPAPVVLSDLVGVLREISDAHAMTNAMAVEAATVEDCHQLAESLNGSVVSFCTRAGGHLAGADRRVVSALGRFGRNVGAALHIAENLSELTSVHPQTQRDVLLRPTPSLAVVSAIGHDPHLSLALKTLRDTEDIALAQEIAERVDAFGGLDVANEAVLHYSWQARRALAAVPQNGYRNSLDQLALNLAISA